MPPPRIGRGQPTRDRECYAVRPVSGDESRTLTTICDQFDYAPDLSAETFQPRIPDGFANMHPDEMGQSR